MPSEFLRGADNLATLQWDSEPNSTVRTARTTVKGFGFLKHRYQITHDTENHTLSVKRLYNSSGSDAGTPVQLGYQQAEGQKAHLTSQWIIRLLLTRGDEIDDVEKGKILAKRTQEQPDLSVHCQQLLDWLSDGVFTGKLPKLGVSCTSVPRENAHFTQKAKTVVTSMIEHGDDKALNILKGKSIEFQISMVKHLLEPGKLNEDDKNKLFTSLLDLDGERVESIISALVQDSLVNESQLYKLSKRYCSICLR